MAEIQDVKYDCVTDRAQEESARIDFTRCQYTFSLTGVLKTWLIIIIKIMHYSGELKK
ncbi:hypothetical protein [Methanosarcina sp.]|uniref:hypothetical protein n=1 Tax=Methanosarcina sp. TaxID=2213 RepID=UPI003C78454D